MNTQTELIDTRQVATSAPMGNKAPATSAQPSAGQADTLAGLAELRRLWTEFRTLLAELSSPS